MRGLLSSRLQNGSRIIQEVDQVSFVAIHHCRSRLNASRTGRSSLLISQFTDRCQLGGSDCLAFFGCAIGVVVRIDAAGTSSSSSATAATRASSVQRETDHFRSPQLKDFGKSKVRNAIDSNVKGSDRRIVAVGRLGDEMTSDRGTKVGDAELELMLKDLIRRPPVQARLGVVHVPSIGHDLPLAAVQTPGKDDFMFAAATMSPRQALCDGLRVRHAELEGDLLLGKSKRLGRVLHAVIDLVRGKHGGAGWWWATRIRELRFFLDPGEVDCLYRSFLRRPFNGNSW